MSISEDKRAAIKSVFDLFDRDGNGHINSVELGEVMRGIGQNPTNAEIEEIITRADASGNGTIELDEFINVISETGLKSKEQEEDDMRAAFQVFDKNGDGFISKAELRDTLTSLGEKMSEDEVDNMLTIADTNEDGKVNYNEFVKVMCDF